MASSISPRKASTPAPTRVLVVDDDESFREVMAFQLSEDGHEVGRASDGAAALRAFDEKPYPVVVTDLKMPHMSGLELLRALKERSADVVVVMITAFGDTATAVESMKAGAFDFLPKPCDRTHLKLVVGRAVEHANLKAQVNDLRGRLDGDGREMVCESAVMKKVLQVADRVARSDTTVLILGESGTGKELLARRMHHQSGRASGPFVAINCAAIPRDLIESELFGHTRGAFTGAVRARPGRFSHARGGTIFLDEVGELPPEVQVRLLRVLQERTIDVIGQNRPEPIDVRVISATNRDLRRAVDSGAFREDLYFRLAVFPIQLPPLRDRPEDIPALLEDFLVRFGGTRPFVLTDECVDRLVGMPWRGNVRELQNIVQRMVLLAEDDIISNDVLDLVLSPAQRPRATVSSYHIQLPPEGISLVYLERDVIVRALEMNGYNQTRTAKFLGIARHVLLYRLEKFGIRCTRPAEQGEGGTPGER